MKRIISDGEPLPIKYVEEIINADILRGRTMGLMAEISKRTDEPITFEDDILKQDNMMLHAFLRVVKVITKEEQRVLNALIDETKAMSNSEEGKESENGTIRALEFVKGWKFEANKIFEEGGDMYDLLSFTSPEFVERKNTKESEYGYRGKIENIKLIAFEQEGKYGLKDKSGNVILECKYDKIEGSSWNGRGWSILFDGKWGAVNERGETLFETRYEEIKVKYEGGHYIKKDGKWGFCDADGNYTVDCIYDEIENYSSEWNGFKVKESGKWGYIDDNGQIIVPIEYDYISFGSNRMLRVKKGEKYGFFNLNDCTLIPLDYDMAYDFTSSHPNEAVVKSGNLWAVIDTHNKFILPFAYQNIDIDDDNTYRVKQNGLYGIINRDGKVLFPFKYTSLGKFDKSGITFAANHERKFGYINRDNKIVINFIFDGANNFEGNYAVVSNGWDRDGVVDKYGKIVIPLIYHSIHIRWDDIVQVENRDDHHRRFLYGMFDLKKQASIPCIYERIDPVGRDMDGVMECRCWRDREHAPEIIKMQPRTMTIEHIGDVYNTYTISYRLVDANRAEITSINKGTLIDNNNIGIEVNSVNGILTLPSEIEGTKVVSLVRHYMREEELSIKGLIIPEGYKEIGADVLADQQSIEFVSLPDRLNRIALGAFAHCKNLKHVFIGSRGGFLGFMNPFSIIDGAAFENCHPDITFYIPERFAEREFDRNRFSRIDSRESNEERIIEEYRCIGKNQPNGLSHRIAIARDFAVTLKEENPWEIVLHGHNSDFIQLTQGGLPKIQKVAAGFDGYMALLENGKIVPGPHAREFEVGNQLLGLENVKDIVACEGHIVVLHDNGTVTCIDEPRSYEGPDRFAEEVRNWQGIIQIACGFDFVLGLKQNGTLISAGRYYRCPNWTGVKQIDAFNCYYGNCFTIAILNDGRVVSDFTNEVEHWHDVVQVAVGNSGFAVGLKSDGDVYAIGNERFVHEVQSWHDVAEINCKFNHAVAILKRPGDVVVSTFNPEFSKIVFG